MSNKYFQKDDNELIITPVMYFLFLSKSRYDPYDQEICFRLF